jgi:hypothetical protein
MNWQIVSDHLAAQHGSDHQAIYRIEQAVRSLRESLDTLAALGHSFHIEGGPAVATPEWPKVMFHENCHQGQLIHCEEDLAELGDGWRSTLAEARFAHGLRQQFKGRGGVKLRDVPALVAGQQIEGATLSRAERIAAAKTALEEYWATISGEEDAEHIPQNAPDNGSSEARPLVREEDGDSAERREGLRLGGREKGALNGKARSGNGAAANAAEDH